MEFTNTILQMEHRTSSPNERVSRTNQLAKLSFNHPSVVLTADVFQHFHFVSYKILLYVRAVFIRYTAFTRYIYRPDLLPILLPVLLLLQLSAASTTSASYLPLLRCRTYLLIAMSHTPLRVSRCDDLVVS